MSFCVRQDGLSLLLSNVEDDIVRSYETGYQEEQPSVPTSRRVVVEPVTNLTEVASGLEPRLEGGLAQNHLPAALVIHFATS